MKADFIESRCTEYGASEVDGSPSGTRFGGGQSESRTKAQPARCTSHGPARLDCGAPLGARQPLNRWIRSTWLPRCT